MSQLKLTSVLVAVLVTAASLHFIVPIRAADSKYIWHLSPDGSGWLYDPIEDEAHLEQLAARPKLWLEHEWKYSKLASLYLERHPFSDDAVWGHQFKALKHPSPPGIQHFHLVTRSFARSKWELLA